MREARPPEHSRSVTDAELNELREMMDSGVLTRRELVRLLAVGGVGAVITACDRRSSGDARTALQDSVQAHPAETPAELPWVKDPTPFIQHPTNLETPLESLDGLLTPNDLFFVRNHAPTPIIDPAQYRLRIEGDAVERPLELTFDQVLDLPAESLTAYLECAGNWRGFFAELLGAPASGGQWGTGAVGCAEWRGPTLGSVLDLAGVRSNAVDVNLIGMDEGEFSRPMPVEKALESTTLLAYGMNGLDLPADHGAPLRAVVPGWVGSNSIKWLSRIVVSSQKIWTKTNTTSYVLIGDAWPPDRYAPADGGPITTLNVKSALALPRPAALPPGPTSIRGYAYSPDGPVQRVEWRVDGGPWTDARIVDPVLPHAWQMFTFDWNATAGEHTLETRATDSAGVQQPDVPVLNEKGYLLNIPLPYAVTVG